MKTDMGHWLQLAARLHRARLAEAIEDLGVFPGQEQLLVTLEQNGEATVGDLAERLKVRPPTISKTLQRLQAQGLLERRNHKDDARKTTVALTEEGVRRARLLESRIFAVDADITDLLDGKDAKRLRKLLKRLTKALGTDSASEDDDDRADSDD